jgi:hypothetical protein
VIRTQFEISTYETDPPMIEYAFTCDHGPTVVTMGGNHPKEFLDEHYVKKLIKEHHDVEYGCACSIGLLSIPDTPSLN